jgi:hypothetical protein
MFYIGSPDIMIDDSNKINFFGPARTSLYSLLKIERKNSARDKKLQAYGYTAVARKDWEILP